jgi:ParB family transcriptional regulator, chromosome partitioning protein
MNKKSGLGRGLGALIEMETVTTSGSSSISEVDITKIQANPDQPRTYFDEEALQELATSIKEVGIIQPITLRQVSSDTYQIIAGERRYRASKIAGLTKIPAYVKTVDDEAVMEMALVENIQREDLNAIEIALSYQKLIEISGYTQETMSERVGKKRSTIANYLRLLKLPAEIQLGITNKKIDMGHARALVTIADATVMLQLYEKIVKESLSVRKVEELVKALDDTKQAPASKTNIQHRLPEEYVALSERLSAFLRVPVKIERNQQGKGKIVLPFMTDEELESLLDTFDKMM